MLIMDKVNGLGDVLWHLQGMKKKEEAPIDSQ